MFYFLIVRIQPLIELATMSSEPSSAVDISALNLSKLACIAQLNPQYWRAGLLAFTRHLYYRELSSHELLILP